MTQLSDAEIVIIGGGAIGCGVAHALVQAGKTDILLLERRPELADVTTSQGAGLCGQVRTTPERTRLAMHSARTFAELQKDEDPSARPEWHAVGSLRVALSDERVAEFRDMKSACDSAGLEVDLMDAAAAKHLWPMDLRSAKSVLWCPTDGYMRPRSVVHAYVQRCKRAGVRFATSTTVQGIVTTNGHVSAVDTSSGRVNCKTVINAAGAHAFHVARLVGLELPIIPVRHEYFVTGPLKAGLNSQSPCFRIPDLTLYGRAENDQLLLGGWEPKALSVDPRSFELAGKPPAVEPDNAVLRQFAVDFAPMFPAVAGAPCERIGKGWPTFTPDGHFIIGPSRRVGGFVMAGGCNAHGISGSPGIGLCVVESMLEANPSTYVRSLSPDRFTETTWDWDTAQSAARGIYETYYSLLV